MNDRICAVPDCGKCSVRAWLCGTHARRWRLYGTLTPPDMRKERDRPLTACRGGGCTASVTAEQCTTGLCKRCYRRQWYLDHRDHERATMATWYAENAEHKRSEWAKWRAQNVEHLREYRKRNYEANRDAALARRADYRRRNPGAGTAWRKANPERWALQNRENARRRAKAKGSERVDYAAILAEHGMVCHICGGEIPTLDDLHFDHVIPLARGGLHVPENIRPSHAVCNLRKGVRFIA